MIGLSLLSTSHPLSFQPKWVRPSTGSYPRFSLLMDSSPGFASTVCDKSLLRLLVGKRFQVLFHSPLGVLFTFPSRYWFTIGHKRVFRIGGWTPQVPTGFHVSGSTQVPLGSLRRFAYGAFTLSRQLFQAILLPRSFVTSQ